MGNPCGFSPRMQAECLPCGPAHRSVNRLLLIAMAFLLALVVVSVTGSTLHKQSEAMGESGRRAVSKSLMKDVRALP